MPLVTAEAMSALRLPGAPRMTVLLPPDPGRPSAVGLLSGSFDPPTVAHQALAAGLASLGCDLVLYVWSVRTLPKEAAPGGDPVPPLLDAGARLECLAVLAGAAGRGLALSSHGLIADQAEAATRRFPEARLVVGMGSDKVLQLLDPRWYEDRAAVLDRLTGLATVAYATRTGEVDAVAAALADPANARWAGALAAMDLPAHVADISSRQVRAKLRAGEDVAPFVPPEVLDLVPRPEPRSR